MSRKRRQRRSQLGVQDAFATVASSRLLPTGLLPFLCGVALAALIAICAVEPDEDTPRRAAATSTQNGLATLGELALMPASELAQQDLALLNLRCASDLPGAEQLDIEKCLATLGHWAESVRHETERHVYKYRNNPAEFQNSEGYQRMLMLITVLQQAPTKYCS